MLSAEAFTVARWVWTIGVDSEFSGPPSRPAGMPSNQPVSGGETVNLTNEYFSVFIIIIIIIIIIWGSHSGCVVFAGRSGAMNYLRWRSETGRAWRRRRNRRVDVVRVPVHHGGLVKKPGGGWEERRHGGGRRTKTDFFFFQERKIGRSEKTKSEMRKEVWKTRQRAKKRRRRRKKKKRKREPGCRGALPAVCVVRAFQPAGS